MNQFLSIKSFMLLVLAATAFVSCEDDKNNTVSNPLVFEKTAMTVAEQSSTPIVITNAGIDPTTIAYASSNTTVATAANGVIKANTAGETYITAFVKGKYLSTITTKSCLVTVTDVAPTGIKFVTPLVDFNTIPFNTKDTILFDIYPQAAYAEVEVLKSDSVISNLEYTVKMAPAGSANADTLFLNAVKEGDVTFSLAIKEKLTKADVKKIKTADAKVNVKAITPTAMKLFLYNEDQIEDTTSTVNTIYLSKGESVSVWVKFYPIENSYSQLQAILNNKNITVAPSSVTFKKPKDKDGKQETYTRPALIITAAIDDNDKDLQTVITVQNNSGLQQYATVYIEKPTEVILTKTITAPVEAITVTPTAENPFGLVAFGLPTFDEGVLAENQRFSVKMDFTQLTTKDKNGKVTNLPMLNASDIFVDDENDSHPNKIVVSKGALNSNQGYASIIYTAVDDNDQPLKDAKGKEITATTKVNIPKNVWFNPEYITKQSYDFKVGKYEVKTTILYTNGDNGLNGTATLYKKTFKLDADKKPVFDKNVKVGETITLKLNEIGNILYGNFAPFAEATDKKLENYYIDYVLTRGSAKWTTTNNAFIVDNGFAGVNKK